VEAASALLIAEYPHRAHEPEHWGRVRPPDDEQRWVIRGPDGRLAAYLALWRVSDSRFRMDLVVAPPFRRRGIGARLLDFLIEQARSETATSLQARPYADAADAFPLLAGRGFRETMRMIGLALDRVDAVDLAPFASLDAPLSARGIRFTTLAAELERDALVWEKLRDANQAAEFGWPEPDPLPNGARAAPESVEQFRSRSMAFGMIADACFIALRDDRYVGYAALATNDAAGSQAGSGGTAVRPEERGLGIATALKARCIAWAREHGVRRLATSTGNPAMVRVNEKFGFRRTYVEVRLVKRLG
jgi:GNAT superfamily N-acetyltransferase